MRLSELEAVVESLLFISGEAVPLGAIAQTIEMDKATAKAIIHTLADKYENEKRGVRIVEFEGSYQMCTASECFEYIRNMYKSPNRQGLTQSLLETLAIIAYKQPITRAQIEEIRGVSAEHAVSKLVEKKLVCEVGRMDSPGKPIMFGTTNEFLRYFGFKSVLELPALDEAPQAEEGACAEP
ncbi:SMC-Scp complex subunit ScpB [Anaerotignum sp.]|uniref:SMC-Scp complex subunit ScpB n=1 Tax=Anaerotignum sp. TaxID=2039241 RepID=UPI003320E954